MHPVRRVEEQAKIRGYGHVVADEMLQRRRSGALGMDALGDLGQLIRIAQQDDRAARSGHGQDVGQ